MIQGMNLAQMGEFGFIRRMASTLTTHRDVILGVGDDAAVVRAHPGRLLLLTCDPVIEGVHFETGTSPELIGRKALARNLSDLAAMGGTPRYAVVSAVLPSRLPVSIAMRIQMGIQKLAKKYDTQIVGGDTSQSKKGMQITLTLVGDVSPGKYLTRSGARPGDWVCTTGTLGGSLTGKHLKFSPRIPEGIFLAESGLVTSMMDISDGLAGDLQRIASQSNVGFEIHTHRLPLSREVIRLHRTPRLQQWHAVTDGEDYELLLTVPPRNWEKLWLGWKRKFPKLPLTRIGIASKHNGKIKWLDENGSNSFRNEPKGNDHFL